MISELDAIEYAKEKLNIEMGKTYYGRKDPKQWRKVTDIFWGDGAVDNEVVICYEHSNGQTYPCIGKNFRSWRQKRYNK